MEHAISKHFYRKTKTSKWIFDHRNKKTKLDINKLDTKILVYEDMIKTWFLDVANYLTIKNKLNLPSGEEFDTNEAGFVILQIAISYIEGNQQCREGRKSGVKGNASKDVFNRGMKRIFGLKHNKKILEKFYEQARCGLFHEGMTRRLVDIDGRYKRTITLSYKSIKINPYKFLEKIEDDFNNYIKELKDSKKTILRKKFDTFLRTRI
jgi:hypothetical protein